MKRYIFLDLDDTLFQSRRKCPPGEPVKEISHSANGQPTSFITNQQQEFFKWLTDGAEVIPTTARSIDSFQRVNIPFTGYAICSFGGIILEPDGNCHPDWQTYIAPLVKQHRDFLFVAAKSVKDFAELQEIDVRIRIVSDAGYDFYVSIKHNQSHVGELDRIVEFMQAHLPSDWRIHFNDNNVGLLPPYLGKEYAVSWFIERYINVRDSLIIGVGDSLTDADFMALGDYAIMPPRSQLFTSLLARKSGGV